MNKLTTKMCKKGAAFISALLFMACFIFSGCHINVLSEVELNDAEFSAFPKLPTFTLSKSDYKTEEKRVLYPEDADEDTAQYILTYSVPTFSDDLHFSEGMNSVISMFEAELMKRVEDERLPYADRVEGHAAPYTNVSCEVSSSRGFINIIFTERFGYGTDEETFTHTVVMRDGKRVGLSAASGAYDAEERAAQQVLNIIYNGTGNVSYYSDLEFNDIISAIDMYSGFYVVDDGYTLICKKGTLAPESLGEITLTISSESMYPDVVGDIISVDEYESLSPVLDQLVYAAFINNSGFTSGSPNKAVSTSFMLALTYTMQAVIDDIEVSDNGVLILGHDTFENLFASMFNIKFPGTAETSQGLIVSTDDGYTMYTADVFNRYRFSLSDISKSGDTLWAVGEIMYGDPDNAYSVCGATIALSRSSASPIGFKLLSLEFN